MSSKYHRKRDRSRSHSPKKHHKKSYDSPRKYNDQHNSNRGGSRSDSEDEDVDFEKHRWELDKMFFGDRDFVKKGSQNYIDFWPFLRKYTAMQKKQGIVSQASSFDYITSPKDAQGFPLSYDKRALVPFSLKIASVDDLMARLPFHDREEDSRKRLSKKQILQFQEILLIYLDFLQKERFNKLRKLRESQANLPIAQYREEIVQSLHNNQVIIVAGDTGCGKSTQVPQYLLHAGFTGIACTQPRRIACMSLCKRVAYETLNEFGSQVGYQIRFEKSKTQQTRILFLTEGLLLRQVAGDPTLSAYNVVVLDEVHERHIPGDFLLGVLKCLLHSRSDLKLILMSATINIELFQRYFKYEAPVIQVPGRLYPIKVQYYPIPAEERSSKTSRINPAPYLRILQLIDQKYPVDERGDLLIFVSGLADITAIVDVAKQYAQQQQRWIVLPLHSALSIAEQDKVFHYAPDGVRKCIVSTNIAETSVTIDGVRFVVDSGKVKEMNYDPVSKLQKLQEFFISKASAEQRKGRAGRTGPGVCFRLYTEQEYADFPAYSTPEIQRVPVDSMLLQMISMGLPDARRFPFIEPPPAESIENSVKTLREKGALTEDEKLTDIGRCLANLPVDVTIGKMLIMGSLFHHLEPVLILAALLSVQNPFTNRAHRDPDCENARKNLESDHGDPITLLNAYRSWLEIKSGKNEKESNSRKWCKRRGLEEQRFYEVTKLREQFRDLLKDAGLLKTTESQALSGAERSARHGEVKQLRSVKREYHRSAPKKKRFLKIGDDEEDEEVEGEVDIKDVEFRLKNDQSKVHELLLGSKANSYQDLMLLKLILCSGLCPQVAITDEYNSYKSNSEQLFHTRTKPFTALHPMSVFAYNPEVLQLVDSDIVQVPGFSSKRPVSSRHQILCYVSLLETTKVYLMNPIRMPAVQTLLLFSQSIDTSEDCTRIVCDSWLEIKFPDPSTGASLLLKAMQLRFTWHELLMLKLEDTRDSIKDKEKTELKASKLEAQLSQGLVTFTQCEALYTLERLLAADLKVLYLGLDLKQEVLTKLEFNPFWKDFQPQLHIRKGGILMTDFLTYGCLENTEIGIQYLNSTWMCPVCEIEFAFGGLERLQHRVACQLKKGTGEETAEDIQDRKPTKSGESYFCPDCKEQLYITGIELLRHKKMHSNKGG